MDNSPATKGDLERALLENEIKFRDYLEEHYARRPEVEALYHRIGSVEDRTGISESDVREIAREEAQGISKERVDARDAITRIVSFTLAIAAFIFTLRGGR